MNGAPTPPTPDAQRPAAAIQAIALSLIAVTPLLNIGEVGALIAPEALTPVFGRPAGFEHFATPAWLKAVKDLGMWAMLAVGLVGLRAHRRALLGPRLRAVTLVFAVLLVPVCAAALWTVAGAPDPLTAMAQTYVGVRWALPIFLAYALIGAADARFARRMALLLLILLCANTALQALQWATGGWVVSNASSAWPRVAGFFFIPNTAGMFACVAAFWAHLYARPAPLRWLAWAVAALSIIATASAGAVAAYILLLYCLAFDGRWMRARLLALPVLAALVALNIDALATRTDILAFSAPARLELLRTAASTGGLVSAQFGLGTNGGRLIGDLGLLVARAPILDSFPATVLYNLGWLGALVFGSAAVLLGGLSLRAYVRDQRAAPLAFCVLYGVMAAGASFSEAYPQNLLFSVWLAMALPALVTSRISR